LPRLMASDRMMEVAMNTKTRSGNYFEDFRLGQEVVHATPRTVTDGDIALSTALFGSRFVVTSSAEFAAGLGLERLKKDLKRE